MTTYQDILDYLTRNYDRGYRLFSNEPEVGLYTFTNEGYNSIIIYKDSYSTSLSLIIDSKLSHLLADLLDTPVDKRFKPEIEHTFKPVTERELKMYSGCILKNADQIIGKINSFILKELSVDPNRVLLFVTTFNKEKLQQVISLFTDFNITVLSTSHKYGGLVYILSIKAK